MFWEGSQTTIPRRCKKILSLAEYYQGRYCIDRMKICIVKKQILILLILCLLLTGCSGKITNNPLEEHSLLKITALNVGKADSILIWQDENTILIDTGEKEDGGKILEELSERKIDSLDYLIITHYDKDHVGSAAEILQNIPVGTVLCPDYEGTREEYFAFLQEAQNQKNLSYVTEITELDLGEMHMIIYPAENPKQYVETDQEYDNDLSLVCSLNFEEKYFLFTGDIEKKRTNQILEEGLITECDWIKIPHHGNYRKSLKNLLEDIHPQYAVISTSIEEPPEEKMIKLLEDLSIEYKITYEDVVTVCDGTKIWME